MSTKKIKDRIRKLYVEAENNYQQSKPMTEEESYYAGMSKAYNNIISIIEGVGNE